MAAAWVKHPRSTRILAWSFALGAVALVAGVAFALVGVVVAAMKESRR